MARVYIGLGANLGNREATIERAIHDLAIFGVVEAVSPIYETDPVGFLDQPKFLNAAVQLDTDLEPCEVLIRLRQLERNAGRIRSFKDAPRTLDLDLLLYDGLVMDTEELTVPHPRLHQRAFVLAPLADIAPAMVHPVLHQTISELLAAVDSGGVEPYWPST